MEHPRKDYKPYDERVRTLKDLKGIVENRESLEGENLFFITLKDNSWHTILEIPGNAYTKRSFYDFHDPALIVGGVNQGSLIRRLRSDRGQNDLQRLFAYAQGMDSVLNTQE